MRIVQTFWTGGRFKTSNEGGLTKCQSGLESGEASALADGGHNPLEYGFGWPHAEYNLMSWALSCLSLREHYDEVVLYTDSAGKRILIDELHLPYTDVQVVFDDFPCLPQHWALAKIKTYSLQTKPFLHVDGDIYVPHPLPEDVLAAPLIAQNREIGTHYYRQMMDRILSCPEILIPEFIQKAFSEDSIASYNMGFFGGYDLEFIHRYCDHAFHFMDENQMNDPTARSSRIDCNVFFEQIFFATLADGEGREVASVLNHPMKDAGYTAKEFCDLSRYEQMAFFHLLGGHKGNMSACEMLEKTLLRLYPEYFRRLIYLFPRRNRRLSGRMGRKPNRPSVQMCLAQYEDYLDEMANEWKDIPLDSMFSIETERAKFVDFVNAQEDAREEFLVWPSPYANIFEVPSWWRKKAVRLLREKLHKEETFPLQHVVTIPKLLGRGLKEVPVVDFQMKILALLQGHEWLWKDLQARLLEEFTLREESVSGARLLIYNQALQLMQNGIILTKQKQ